MLCHGQPTLDNILFLYDDKGTPVDAKVNKFNFPNHQTLQLYQFQFVNFSNCRIATPMSDFLVFTNSNAADQSREDFMLRFVSTQLHFRLSDFYPDRKWVEKYD